MKKENLLRKYFYLELKRQDENISEEDVKAILDSSLVPLEVLVNKIVYQATEYNNYIKNLTEEQKDEFRKQKSTNS